MRKFRSVHLLLLIMTIVIAMIITTHFKAQAQLPQSYYYTSPVAFPAYGYTNSIDNYLLGYNAFNPFLSPAAVDAYTLAGIPTFGYLNNTYSTAFPYATIDVEAPYAPPVYPTVSYGALDIYTLWLGLNL